MAVVDLLQLGSVRLSLVLRLRGDCAVVVVFSMQVRWACWSRSFLPSAPSCVALAELEILHVLH